MGLRQLKSKFVVGYLKKTDVCVNFKAHYYFELIRIKHSCIKFCF